MNSSKGGVVEFTAVRLQFHHPTATRVNVAGTFNDWRPETKPMAALGNGRWINDLILPPGVHDYRVVVDGDIR